MVRQLMMLIAIAASAQTGPQWIHESPQTSPPARDQQAMAYDSAHGQMVMFGGALLTNGFLDGINDIWLWDGTTWKQKGVLTYPPPRSGHAMAYDSAHSQVVMFSGGGASNDTWVWDGTNWTNKSPQNSPSARSNHAMVYGELGACGEDL